VSSIKTGTYILLHAASSRQKTWPFPIVLRIGRRGYSVSFPKSNSAHDFEAVREVMNSSAFVVPSGVMDPIVQLQDISLLET
jgi:hypothetical protein